MKTKRLLMICAVCMVLAISNTASAYVVTSQVIDRSNGSIYVAGNPDFYPIEYYDKDTKQFAGVIPEILSKISKDTGIDFTYIYTEKMSRTELGRTLKADIVSSYITDSNDDFVSDKVTIVSYLFKGAMVNVGLAFTQTADEELIGVLKEEAAKVTEKEINGYLVQNSYHNQNKHTVLVIIAILCVVLLAVLILMTFLATKIVKKRMLENRMIDAQTGIGNLMHFEHSFESGISDFSRTQYYIAYIIIDSNYLQLYHGESTFTDAVKYTASVINSYSKDNEIAARITENGFAFAYQSASAEKARLRIEKIINKLTLYIGAESVNAKPVFHAALYKLSSADRNCGLLLFNLRRNCSKLIGTEKQLVVCDTQMMNSAVIEKLMLESMTNGFQNKEFKLYLQFIVDNKTKRIVSAEALSRWENPDKGLLMPGEYIKKMEENGMISTLDYYMFEIACMQLHKWKDTEFDNITLSCNFTRITISELNFTEKIRDIAKKYVFNREKLIIEITEDAIEQDLESAMDNVLQCKEMGFRIALDDLGNGYTSLVNLCEYPIDIVKIDRDILNKADNKNGRDLFRGIIALAHSLNLKVVCEGVETEEHVKLVSKSDCDYLQGWYYSKALPVCDGEKFMREYSEKNKR